MTSAGHASEKLTRITRADSMRLGGAEGMEQIMWLALRGAVAARLKRLHQNYVATTTAMTVVLYEESS